MPLGIGWQRLVIKTTFINLNAWPVSNQRSPRLQSLRCDLFGAISSVRSLLSDPSNANSRCSENLIWRILICFVYLQIIVWNIWIEASLCAPKKLEDLWEAFESSSGLQNEEYTSMTYNFRLWPLIAGHKKLAISHGRDSFSSLGWPCKSSFYLFFKPKSCLRLQYLRASSDKNENPISDCCRLSVRLGNPKAVAWISFCFLFSLQMKSSDCSVV